MESLRERLIDAKLAGRKSPGGPEGVYAYYFRSNEQAADAALAALGLGDFDAAVDRLVAKANSFSPPLSPARAEAEEILRAALFATGEGE